MNKPTRPPLRYHGGKWRMAQHIIPLFPVHMTYCEPNENGTSNCLTCVQKDNLVLEPRIEVIGSTMGGNDYKIRKLTPLECWRLQDFSDEAFYKAQNAGVSNSQLYKQAGNSMSVNVLEMIFRQIENAKNGKSNNLF